MNKFSKQLINIANQLNDQNNIIDINQLKLQLEKWKPYDPLIKDKIEQNFATLFIKLHSRETEFKDVSGSISISEQNKKIVVGCTFRSGSYNDDLYDATSIRYKYHHGNYIEFQNTISMKQLLHQLTNFSHDMYDEFREKKRKSELFAKLDKLKEQFDDFGLDIREYI